jgi:hypothetical protein
MGHCPNVILRNTVERTNCLKEEGHDEEERKKEKSIGIM